MIKQLKQGYQVAKSFVLGKTCVADKLADKLVQLAPKTKIIQSTLMPNSVIGFNLTNVHRTKMFQIRVLINKAQNAKTIDEANSLLEKAIGILHNDSYIYQLGSSKKEQQSICENMIKELQNKIEKVFNLKLNR